MNMREWTAVVCILIVVFFTSVLVIIIDKLYKDFLYYNMFLGHQLNVFNEVGPTRVRKLIRT